MWSRPDTGATPTSYPVSTWSALKGIFESVAFFKDGKAWIRPIRVEICKPVGIYSWIDSYEYDADFLGIMGGILNPDAFFKETGGVI